jgi:hypothetical protein
MRCGTRESAARGEEDAETVMQPVVAVLEGVPEQLEPRDQRADSRQ